MSLEHHLRISGDGVPELNASVFRTAHDPMSVGCQADAEHKVLTREVSNHETSIGLLLSESMYLPCDLRKCGRIYHP